MKDKKEIQWLITKLRRISLYWPARQACLSAARIERGFYRCNICQGSFSRKEIHIDHINPVVTIKTGFKDWNEYISQLFCDINGLQAACLNCHASKTILENNLRKINKKKTVKKLDKKSKL